MLVSSAGIKPLPDKVEVIQRIPKPKTVRELKSFLGIAGFYHRFIPHFSHIAQPLTDLTRGVSGKSTASIKWTSDADNAFKHLKSALQNSVTLAFPCPSAKLELTTDASLQAAGAVLHQIIEFEKQPIAFFSRKFTPQEMRKSAFDREL